VFGRHGGGQGLARGHADDRQPGAQRDAVRQRQRGAQPGEAARPHHRGDGVEVGGAQPGLGQHGGGHGRQRGGVAAVAVAHPVRE
jgi:hypothetical protein